MAALSSFFHCLHKTLSLDATMLLFLCYDFCSTSLKVLLQAFGLIIILYPLLDKLSQLWYQSFILYVLNNQ